MSKPTREELIETIDSQEREILRLRQENSILAARMDTITQKSKREKAALRAQLRKAQDATQGKARR